MNKNYVGWGAAANCCNCAGGYKADVDPGDPAVDPNVPDVPVCLPCTSYATFEETNVCASKGASRVESGVLPTRVVRIRRSPPLSLTLLPSHVALALPPSPLSPPLSPLPSPHTTHRLSPGPIFLPLPTLEARVAHSESRCATSDVLVTVLAARTCRDPLAFSSPRSFYRRLKRKLASSSPGFNCSSVGAYPRKK